MPWDESSPYVDAAYEGRRGFDGNPYEDFWGTWVSAYVPMRDPDGNVEAVLGVDYDAGEWRDALSRARWLAYGALAVFLKVFQKNGQRGDISTISFRARIQSSSRAGI